MAYSKKLNLIFIWVPKCAGTSIVEAMNKIDASTDYGHHHWFVYNTPKIVNKRPVSFAVVRNPWDRVFSCYKYSIQKENYWHGDGKKYPAHLEYELLKNYSFKDAVRVLYDNRQLLDLPEISRPNFRHNWNYQYPYVFNGAKKMVDQLFRFELMNEVIKWLSYEYNLDVPFLNVSTSGEDYRQHYDKDTVDLVSEIYADDIEIFDYEFE